MKCEYCDINILKIKTGFGDVIINKESLDKWLSMHPNGTPLSQIDTDENGVKVYYNLPSTIEYKNGTTYILPHTCYQQIHIDA